jgi:hypothetical protein
MIKKKNKNKNHHQKVTEVLKDNKKLSQKKRNKMRVMIKYLRRY